MSRYTNRIYDKNSAKLNIIFLSQEIFQAGKERDFILNEAKLKKFLTKQRIELVQLKF